MKFKSRQCFLEPLLLLFQILFLHTFSKGIRVKGLVLLNKVGILMQFCEKTRKFLKNYCLVVDHG